MSTRGVRHDYTVGEVALCFEPDPTKARVLYYAKILETAVTKDKNGYKIPAYHVHFQGWNNSWDRIVPENFILKNTEENRQLMKKLADTTKKYRINKSRNRRIDHILKKAFRGKPSLFTYDSDDSPYDDDDVEYTDSESEVEFKDQSSDADEGGKSETGNEESESVNGSEENGSESGSSRGSRGDDKRKKINIELDVPDVLKEELEKDFIAITRQNMLVRLPMEPNIISILESFVKTFCVNLLYSAPLKGHVLHKEGVFIPFERIIPMSKELVDGLRICFDYTLPLILLYGSEKEQFKKLTATYKYKPKSNGGIQPPPLRTPTRMRSSSRHTPGSPSNGDSSPKIPRLSPKIFKEKPDFGEPPPAEEVTPRRITRRALHDSARKSQEALKSPVSDLTSGSDDNEEKKAEPVRKRELRGSRRLSELSSSGMNSPTKIEVSVDVAGSSGTSSHSRADPPPPLLIPSTISSLQHSEVNCNDSRASSVDSVPTGSCREDILDRILAWKLLPVEMIEQNPTAPSLMYGAQHLLRMFVKLPDLITSMRMKEDKVKVLLYLLHYFLEYFVERHKELFQETAYVPHDDSV